MTRLLPPDRLLAALAAAREGDPLAVDVPEPELEVLPGAPAPSGVTYAHPNPDGSAKGCASCFMWRSTDERCAIHPPEVPAFDDSVCGYHVFGQPQGERIAGVRAVDPSTSGLEIVDGSASCSRCRFYLPGDAARGVCSGVVGSDGGPAPVEAMGCCSRWEPVKKTGRKF